MKQLKSELAALDRKLAAELAPIHDDKDGEEINPETQQQQAVKALDPPGQATDDKKSMVAELMLKAVQFLMYPFCTPDISIFCSDWGQRPKRKASENH